MRAPRQGGEGRAHGAPQPALAGLGWTDGRNERMDLRWGGDDISRMRALAQELVGLHPDIIVTGASGRQSQSPDHRPLGTSRDRRSEIARPRRHVREPLGLAMQSVLDRSAECPYPQWAGAYGAWHRCRAVRNELLRAVKAAHKENAPTVLADRRKVC
jgi:hypothetical protein